MVGLDPHATIPNIAVNKMTMTTAGGHRFLRNRHSMQLKMSPPPVFAHNGVDVALAIDAGPIVKVEVTAAPAGVTVDGENEQPSPEGKPEQLNLIAWANPFCGVTVSVTVAD